ncbi:putative ribonuclease H-like domain-containing protein, partial [Tanacetum coccineum]
ALTKSMNYKPVVAGNQSNGNVDTKACDDAGKARMKTVPGKDYILLPLWTTDPPFSQSSKSSPDARFKPSGYDEKKVIEEPRKEGGDLSKEGERDDQEKDADVNSTNNVYTVSSPINIVGQSFVNTDGLTFVNFAYLLDDPNMSPLEDIVYSDDDEDVGAEADMNNLDAFMHVSPIPTTRVHKDHPVQQIIRDLNSAPQTRRMTKNLKEHVMQDELLQLKLQKVWTLLDLQNGKRPIGTKWVYRNKKDGRGIVIKNKARIEAIRLFLAYASFKDFVVYQMDVKSAFLYLLDNGFQRGKLEKTLFIRRDKGDILLVQVYVDDIIFGSIKKSLCIEFEKMMHRKFQISSIDELTFFLGLQV